MPPAFSNARPQSTVATRFARRGWAVARTCLLVFATGLVVAIVLATIFGALVIAINGELP
jgi:hypothetical protein